MNHRSPVTIGVLAPLTPPGWVEAGRHLVTGLALGVRHVNETGGIDGHPLELLLRDTSADARRAAAAVDELTELGVAALAGEYHSVAARAAAARAIAVGVPFLCSSAVIDSLASRPTRWIARLPPPQSEGWRAYAEFILQQGHRRIATVAAPGVYWEAGAGIIGNHVIQRGGVASRFEMPSLSIAALCDALADSGATAILLLVGHPEPIIPTVHAIREDPRLVKCTVGAPAGQPEFADWAARLGDRGAEVAFLRYLPDRLDARAMQIAATLSASLHSSPSFVAFEGYDSILVLAEGLRAQGVDGFRTAPSWERLSIAGTRGSIRFHMNTGTVWQCNRLPIQIVDRDPAAPARFRILQSGASTG